MVLAPRLLRRVCELCDAARMTSPWSAPNLQSAAPVDLFRLYAGVMAELKSRNIVRTANPPAGDYGEWLVHRALGGTLANNSVKSYDVSGTAYGRVQVKARAVSATPKSGQLQTSPFRSDDFEWAALVMLDESDFTVVRASLLPVVTLRQMWSWRAHVNGHTVRMTPAVMGHPDATDITDRLRKAATS